MDVMFPYALTECRDVQPENNAEPMDVTELGIEALVREVLFLKTLEPTAVTE